MSEQMSVEGGVRSRRMELGMSERVGDKWDVNEREREGKGGVL